jgi:hypothetical protein
MAIRIQVRRDSSVNWIANNPILQVGEFGFDTTVNRFKVGIASGETSRWNVLPYLNVIPSELTELAQDAVEAAITAGTGITKTYNDTANTITLSVDTTIANKTYVDTAVSGLGSTAAETYIPLSSYGNADGVATLDENGKIPDSEIPSGIARLASPTFTGEVTLPGNPSSSLQAATKQYVDNTASGIVAKPQVLGATTANIDVTYSNGTAGVGATLTHNTNGVFPSGAGGASGWAVGKGILVKNQTNKAQNGRYYISNMGSVSTPYVLTRCTYCDEASEIPGGYVFVQDGTNAGTGWIQVVEDPATFVVGTDNIDVFQFSGSGTYTAGTGLTLTGNEYSINTSVTADLSTAQTLTNKTLTSPVINTPTGITKSDVGLSNVDNTSDNTKALISYIPVSSATRTISSATDKNTLIECSVACTITIPNDTQDTGWPIGSMVEVRQTGTGQVTITKDAAVTMVGTDSQFKSRVQWSTIMLEKRSDNSWLVTGDTTA